MFREGCGAGKRVALIEAPAKFESLTMAAEIPKERAQTLILGVTGECAAGNACGEASAARQVPWPDRSKRVIDFFFKNWRDGQ